MRQPKALAIAFPVLFLAVIAASAAQIPSFYVDCVVALGAFHSASGQLPQWQTEASGFLYGLPVDKETDPAKHQYHLYLVTNRHVLANHTEITIRLNAESTTGAARVFTVPLKDAQGAELFVSHPNPSVDVSVLTGGPAFGSLLATLHERDNNIAAAPYRLTILVFGCPVLDASLKGGSWFASYAKGFATSLRTGTSPLHYR